MNNKSQALFKFSTNLVHPNIAPLKSTYRRSLVCCRFLIDGLVSKECGRFRFFPVAMAAAAATPIGPEQRNININSD